MAQKIPCVLRLEFPSLVQFSHDLNCTLWLECSHTGCYREYKQARAAERSSSPILQGEKHYYYCSLQFSRGFFL